MNPDLSEQAHVIRARVNQLLLAVRGGIYSETIQDGLFGDALHDAVQELSELTDDLCKASPRGGDQ